MVGESDAPAPRVLVLPGSARVDSLNKKLAAFAAVKAREVGARTTLIDPRDYPMPIYDGDLESESGMPEHAARLKAVFKEHDALILVCPEYNSSITPLLKNMIDWVSRSAPGEPMKAAFVGKTALLLSASPGALGGLRGLAAVRSILGNIGVTVLPDQYALSNAHHAFDENGEMKDERQADAVAKLVGELARVTRKLNV